MTTLPYTISLLTCCFPGSCEALNPNRSLIRAISQQQQHAQAFHAYPSGHFAVLPGLSPQAKNLTSVSPMIIMSKLSCHVNAILQVGADGTKLQSMLVSGDVSLCYAMGMRGLVGKEAINPWKCVGVEIPVSQDSFSIDSPTPISLLTIPHLSVSELYQERLETSFGNCGRGLDLFVWT